MTDVKTAAAKPWPNPLEKGQPAEYVVYVTIVPTKENGMKEQITSRVGVAHSIDGCRAVVKRDLQDMGNTFGGLIAPAPIKGRAYRFFKAQWTEVTREAMAKGGKL